MIASKKEWTFAEIYELIGLYEAYPALWDVSINDYRNKELINSIIEKFAGTFKCMPQEIGRKIHYLRNQISFHVWFFHSFVNSCCNFIHYSSNRYPEHVLKTVV